MKIVHILMVAAFLIRKPILGITYRNVLDLIRHGQFATFTAKMLIQEETGLKMQIIQLSLETSSSQVSVKILLFTRNIVQHIQLMKVPLTLQKKLMVSSLSLFMDTIMLIRELLGVQQQLKILLIGEFLALIFLMMLFLVIMIATSGMLPGLMIHVQEEVREQQQLAMMDINT